MNEFYRAAIEACRKAAALIDANGSETLMHKNRMIGAGGDRSSGLDLALEQILVEALGSYGTIESEESGTIGEGASRIILDPLDGSSNALSRFPYYGISAARIGPDGVLSEALVCNLANGDLFMLSEEGKPLKGRLGCEGFASADPSPSPEIGLFEKAYAHPGIVAELNRGGLKFRSPGAVALSLAYAYSVRYFLYVGPYRIYDFAAGLALCRDLEVIVADDYVIVTKEKSLASALETIVGTSRESGEEER